MSELDFNYASSFVCPECHVKINFSDALYIEFFANNKIKCPICGNNLQILETFKQSLNLLYYTFGSHYGLIGCINKFKIIRLNPNEVYELDLSEEIGDGELLFINYTPYGNSRLKPIEFHGNTPQPHSRQNTIWLYGATIGDNSPETEVNCFYWYAPAELKDDLSMKFLLDAFKKYYEQDFRYAIVSAFIAVEIAQSEFHKELETTKKSELEKIKPFPTKKKKFYNRLNELLPFFAENLKFPMLNKEVADELNNLRLNRNNIVHEGKLIEDRDEDKIKNELMAALFGYKYYKTILKVGFLG